MTSKSIKSGKSSAKSVHFTKDTRNGPNNGKPRPSRVSIKDIPLHARDEFFYNLWLFGPGMRYTF